MRHLVCVAILAGTIASAAVAQQVPPTPPIRTYIVRNVQVIAMTGREAPRTADVVIRGRTIAQIVRAGTAVASGATIIDGHGQFLIPGLIDSHVHIKEQDPLFLFIAEGVTTAQNMSGRPFHLDMRARVNAGTLLGPRIVTAGPTTAEVGVNTPEEAERLEIGRAHV